MGKPTPASKMKSTDLVTDYKLEPSEMTERVTPASDLFVLAHMGIPNVTVRDWKLRIDGLVDRPLEIGFEQLIGRAKRMIETVHKCAGSPINPTIPTRQVANVMWGGADLLDLLAEARIKTEATHLWAYGLDHGTFAGEAQDCYLKDAPLSRIALGDVLIAYELNGEPLDDRHGSPARLVVPGFYGTNCVKWLQRIHLADRRAESLFTSRYYNDLEPESQSARPVWEIAPESIIVSPKPDETLAPGPIEIWGWAWSDSAVETLEVSTDGGVSWQWAELEERRQSSWQRFAYIWQSGARGAHELCCRAVDATGERQPMDGARNAVHRVNVNIE